MEQRRIGRFYVSLDLINLTPDVLKILFSKMIILRAECLWHMNSIEYIALCDDFDICQECRIPPEYMVNVDKDLTISVLKMAEK